MKSVNIGIVGLGYWGPNLVRNFSAADHCTVAMGCDLEQKNIDRLQKSFPAIKYTKEYTDILKNNEIDLVCIATPTSSHFTLAKAAIEAGKHVLIEKPICQTSDQAKQLNNLATAHNVKIFVDHTFIFAPAVQQIADQVESGALGDLLYFESSRINLGLIQPDCNVLWDLAIHDLSILSTIIDLATAVEVNAYGSAHYGIHKEVAHMDILFTSGFHAHIYSSWLSPVKLRKTVVAGSKAMITFDDIEPSEKIRIYDKGVEHDTTRPDPFFPTYRSGKILIPNLDTKETLAIEANSIIDSIRNNTPIKSSGIMAENMLRILEAADQSLESGTTITLI